MMGQGLVWTSAAVLAFVAGMALAIWRAPDSVTLPAARDAPAPGEPYEAPPVLADAGDAAPPAQVGRKPSIDR